MDKITRFDRRLEDLGYELENFDFDTHNDEGNVAIIERAKQALEDLQAAIADLVP
jgi:hypothetical protein